MERRAEISYRARYVRHGGRIVHGLLGELNGRIVNDLRGVDGIDPIGRMQLLVQFAFEGVQCRLVVFVGVSPQKADGASEWRDGIIVAFDLDEVGHVIVRIVMVAFFGGLCFGVHPHDADDGHGGASVALAFERRFEFSVGVARAEAVSFGDVGVGWFVGGEEEEEGGGEEEGEEEGELFVGEDGGVDARFDGAEGAALPFGGHGCMKCIWCSSDGNGMLLWVMASLLIGCWADHYLQ